MDWTHYISTFGQRQILSLAAHATIRDFNPLAVREFHLDSRKLGNRRNGYIARLYWRERICRSPLLAEMVRTRLPYVETKKLLVEYESETTMSRSWMDQDYMIYGEDVRAFFS